MPTLTRLLLTTFALLAGAWQSPALTTAQIAGYWNVVSMGMPNSITPQTGTGGVVTGINQNGDFHIDAGAISIATDGNFSGTVGQSVSGNFSPAAQGLLTLTQPEESPKTFCINSTLDFVASSSRSSGGGSQELILAVKSPASLAATDMGGTYTIYEFRGPAGFVEHKNDNGELTGLDGVEKFSARIGSLTLTPTSSSVGTLTGSLQDAFSGSYTCTGDGLGHIVASINVSGGPSFDLPLSVNASKDILIGMQLDSMDNSQEILIFVRSPAGTPTVTDTKGVWRTASTETPQAITLNFNGNGVVTGLSGADNFGATEQSLIVGSDGFFTAHFETAATGSFAFPGGGAVNVTVDKSSGQQMKSFQVNTSKNAVFSLASGDGSNELIIAMKAPADTAAKREFGLIALPGSGGHHILWATDAGRVLQSSTDLVNWNDVLNPTTQHSLDVNPTGQPNTYYRVKEIVNP